MNLLKPLIVRAEWWLKEIRGMRCLVPGCMAERSDPHHLGRHRERDDWTVPICRKHHTELTQVGEWVFMKMYDFNPYKTLLDLLLPMYERMKALK